jgi:hypothetical protein
VGGAIVRREILSVEHSINERWGQRVKDLLLIYQDLAGHVYIHPLS